MLIITKSIKKEELEPLKEVFPFDAVLKAASHASKGIGIEIKSSTKVQNSKLIKINLTSPSSAGRAVFLIEVTENNSILVMLRQKNDKKIGENMTVKNKYFKTELNKNLDLIFADIREGRFEEFEIG
jgi:hypothetical protein